MPEPDELFDKVELDSIDRNPCTPKRPEGIFRGILIQAPRRVTFKKGERVAPRDAFARIPICGYYLLPIPSPPTYPNVRTALRFVAVDAHAAAAAAQQEGEEAEIPEYTGHIVERESRAQAPPGPPPTREQLEGLAAGGCFNPNLAECVPLPEQAGVYNVHVDIGDPDADDLVQSNTVTIELVEEQDEGAAQDKPN